MNYILSFVKWHQLVNLCDSLISYIMDLSEERDKKGCVISTEYISADTKISMFLIVNQTQAAGNPTQGLRIHRAFVS